MSDATTGTPEALRLDQRQPEALVHARGRQRRGARVPTGQPRLAHLAGADVALRRRRARGPARRGCRPRSRLDRRRRATRRGARVARWPGAAPRSPCVAPGPPRPARRASARSLRAGRAAGARRTRSARRGRRAPGTSCRSRAAVVSETRDHGGGARQVGEVAAQLDDVPAGVQLGVVERRPGRARPPRSARRARGSTMPAACTEPTGPTSRSTRGGPPRRQLAPTTRSGTRHQTVPSGGRCVPRPTANRRSSGAPSSSSMAAAVART